MKGRGVVLYVVGGNEVAQFAQRHPKVSPEAPQSLQNPQSVTTFTRVCVLLGKTSTLYHLVYSLNC